MAGIQTVWRLASLISGAALVAGCATTGPSHIPHGDMTMAEIYHQQTTGKAPAEPLAAYGNVLPADASSRENAPALSNYTATAQTQIDNQFKLAPNPVIAVYLFPHLSQFDGTRAPVPGYTTTFFLYKQLHYAMPGERY